MGNAGNVLLLFAAIVTCLAVGVVLAYGACNVLFAVMRIRTLGSVAPAPVKAALRPTV